MRPIAPGDDAFASRSRSTSFTDNTLTPSPGAYQAPQMTYFLADEKTMEASLSQSSSGNRRSRDSLKRSNFGVMSLETTISSLNQDSDQDREASTARSNSTRTLANDMLQKEDEFVTQSRSPSPGASMRSRELSPSDLQSGTSQHYPASRPFTPLSLQSLALGSVASSQPSRRNSEVDLTDDAGSQAIMSSGDDEKDVHVSSEIFDSSSASQLVMPSIRMPSRRPFTDKGKNLGRLKVMIAGDSGMSPKQPRDCEFMLIRQRCWKDSFDQGHRANLR